MKENYNKDCHSFNIQMAKEIGLVETLILKHLYYWCYANSDNQDMIKNGYIWVYITRKKIEETYPYLKDGKIRGAIEKLKKDGYILINCFNKLTIDKTNWYALTDKAYKEFGTSLAKLTNPTFSFRDKYISEYKTQLKSKEWKDFRKEVFKIKGKKCEICGSTKQLNIHHPFYTKGKLAWEYNPSDMVVLCHDCHKEIHNIK